MVQAVDTTEDSQTAVETQLNAVFEAGAKIAKSESDRCEVKCMARPHPKVE